MRPFCIATAGSVLGIIIGLYFSSIVLFALIGTLIIIYFLFRSYRKQIAIFTICLFVFASYTIILEKDSNSKIKKYGGQEVEIEAIVMSDKNEKDYKDVYIIKITKIKINNTILSDRDFLIALNVKKSKDKILKLEYGDKISFISTYEALNTSRNEGGFNYRQYLKTKKILGVTNVKTNEITLLEKNQNGFIPTKIHNLKAHLIKNIKDILPNKESGLCIGLLLGQKQEISEDIQEDFRQSNLSHMLAISGAHISYLLIGVTFFINHLKFHKRWSKLLIIGFLLFFMALVGFTTSVTRACIMSILIIVADITFRKSDIYQNLAISSFIILVLNPYSILDIGFQLSFGGTIGIVLLSKRLFQPSKEENLKPISNIKKVFKYIKQMVIMSLAANLMIIPIMLYHFNTISLTFLISNLLASPILGACLIVGLIFVLFTIICTPIAKLISYFLSPILQLLIQIANFSSKLPFSQILLPTPNLLQIFVYYLILVLFLFKSKVKKQYLKLMIFLIFVLIFPYILSIFPTNNLTINFIDVGQGDSMLIQTFLRKTILIDGGGSETGNFDVGEKILLPYLLDKGIMKIDYMMFSHFDSDHCEGLFTILEKLKVNNVIIGKQGENTNNFKHFLQLAKDRKVNIIQVKAGDIIEIDNETYFDILFPDNNLISQNVLNNNSIVAKFCCKFYNFSMLLTGDIEEIAEKQIIQNYKNTNKLQSTILKVAHHGSKSSSILKFLKIVNPKIALIGVGEKNTFGHPNQGVLQRLQDIKATIYRTDDKGEINIFINKKGKVKIKTKCN